MLDACRISRHLLLQTRNERGNSIRPKGPPVNADTFTMKWANGEASETTSRAAARYEFAVPVVIELQNGLFRTADRIDGLLVELSEGGAALVSPNDDRYKLNKRYRVYIDDQEGIVELRNMVPLDETQSRLGVSFHRLDLELQELVVDSLAQAKREVSRIG